MQRLLRFADHWSFWCFFFNSNFWDHTHWLQPILTTHEKLSTAVVLHPQLESIVRSTPCSLRATTMVCRVLLSIVMLPTSVIAHKPHPRCFFDRRRPPKMMSTLREASFHAILNCLTNLVVGSNDIGTWNNKTKQALLFLHILESSCIQHHDKD